jgi:hypothetical protein
MANPVMNYNEFMSIFKKAAYRNSGNIANKDAGHKSKINQGMASNPIMGKGTPTLDKYTKQYLANVKKKTAFKK